MLPGRTQPVLAASSLILSACSGGQQNIDSSLSAPSVTERAAMVLHYPHDDHVFAELPSDLTPVSGARAELRRYADHVSGMIDTRITPGHVGKLIAVVINNPAACNAPTPATACGPHEEEFNPGADGGFYIGSGAVAGADGHIRLTVTARVGDTSNVLCGGAANPDFDSCSTGFSLSDPHGAEVTLVLLDNGPAAKESEALARQLQAHSPCADCPSFTAQVAIGFGRESRRPRQHS